MSDHVAPAKTVPDLRTPEGVAKALKWAEAALREMVWRQDPKAPPEAVEAFYGVGPDAGPLYGVWSATVVGWAGSDGLIRHDGAVVNASMGLVMRMTPDLTKRAVELAHAQIVTEAAR